MPSVTRQPSQSGERREAVVGQVTAAVERLLGEGDGYTALGVQRIADEAGIARSTFYLYFPDKSTLLIRSAETATDALFDASATWVEDGFDDPLALERTLRDVIAQRREHAPLIDAVAEVAGYDEVVAAFWRERIEGFAGKLEQRIARGQDRGSIATGLDPVVTAAWIVWGTERMVGQHVQADDGPGDEGVARGLATAIWTTLGRAG